MNSVPPDILNTISEFLQTSLCDNIARYCSNWETNTQLIGTKLPCPDFIPLIELIPLYVACYLVLPNINFFFHSCLNRETPDFYEYFYVLSSLFPSSLDDLEGVYVKGDQMYTLRPYYTLWNQRLLPAV